ncbi:MAG TPA: NADP-dependent oxidoreductase [Pseudonocardia sp.]|jgi:NADPH2:quinone reductase
MAHEQENRGYRLRQRPDGLVTEHDLEWVQEPLAELADGEALVRTLYLSIDPTNRIWMSDIRGYLPPVPLGAIMRGLGVGEVVQSRREDLPVGTRVMGWTGWQDYCVADDTQLLSPFTPLPDPLPAPLPAFLGALGHTGITAWAGIELADPKPGETVVVSAAAGAVGSIAGQLAKQRGARVVGIAGGEEKCRHVVDGLGFDACVDRHAPDWRGQLDQATPNGIDVDFENAGGEIMDHILGRINIGARIPLCGMIADYNTPLKEQQGLLNVGQILMQRATMRGFLVLDYAPRFGEIIEQLATSLGSGQLHYDETVVDGLENARDALNNMFAGSNRGKLVIRVAGD